MIRGKSGIRRLLVSVPRLLSIAVAASLLCAAIPSISSASECKAVALRRVQAVADPADLDGGGLSDAVLEEGEVFDGITQYWKDTRNGGTSMCAHGSSCYPTHVKIGGEKVEVLRLTNCKPVRPERSDMEPHMLLYSLELEASKATAIEKRMEKAERELSAIVPYPINANNAAMFYARKPESKCGRLVERAIGGDSAAIRILKADELPPYCEWE